MACVLRFAAIPDFTLDTDFNEFCADGFDLPFPSSRRVDGIDVQGQLVLMELEIIEPDLYLDRVPQSAERFAQAIIELSNGQKHR